MAETPIRIAVSDAQAAEPDTRISLSRVGVTGVEKIIRVSANGTEALYHADLECAVDLNPEQAGVHMSRFEEVVNEAIDEVVLGEAFRAETLAPISPTRPRTPGRPPSRGPDLRPLSGDRPAPVSGAETQEIYTLFGTAVSSERGTRTLTGVEAQGMTACPCAQGLVGERARELLAEDGFDPDEIERVIERVPIATHNQRGIGRLYLGCPEGGAVDIDARDLLRMVEGSMSSEIYELMKRSDELAWSKKRTPTPASSRTSSARWSGA